jgi:hypothetical protein
LPGPAGFLTGGTVGGFVGGVSAGAAPGIGAALGGFNGGALSADLCYGDAECRAELESLQGGESCQ